MKSYPMIFREYFISYNRRFPMKSSKVSWEPCHLRVCFCRCKTKFLVIKTLEAIPKKKRARKTKHPKATVCVFFGGPTFTAFLRYFQFLRFCVLGAKAMEILEEMPQSLVQVDLLSFNSAINSLERSDRWQQALDLLDVMQGAEVVASTVTYNAAISCLKTGAQNDIFYFSLFGKLT